MLESEMATNNDAKGLNSLISQLIGTAFFAQKDYSSIVNKNA